MQWLGQSGSSYLKNLPNLTPEDLKVAREAAYDICKARLEAFGASGQAQKIKVISYEEMLEMASLGAKVMQPHSIQDARLNRVDIEVRSSFTDNEGLFLGSSIEGSYLQPRNDLNRFLYKQDFDSEKILNSNESRIEINNIIKIIQNITSEKSKK